MFLSSDSIKGLTTLAIAFLTAFLLQGCDTTGTNSPEKPKREGIELSQQTGHSIHEDFAKMAEKIPDFGGFYLDENGQPTVYLLDPGSARKDEVRSALKEVFGEDVLTFENDRRRSGDAPEVQLREGTYRMGSLLSWYERLPRVLKIDGAIMTDLHERENNLTVGVKTLEATDRVEEKLRELEIPREAVEIIERELPTSHGHNLRSRFRPTRGGVQIVGPSTCTLGFNAVYRGNVGFITNSHCTAQRGSVTGAGFGNPGGGAQIGQESADPNYRTCRGVFACRTSDAAFVEYNGGVGVRGEIARPRNWARPGSGPGTLNIDHGSPSLNVTGTDSHPVSGQIVDKVGRTTGWTYGSVNLTCFSTFAGNGSGGVATVGGRPVLMRCQYEASYSSSGGDSGSPVFDWHGSNVTLTGVHWGGVPGGAIFSPWQGIVNDF